jgi:ornithine cyclodeaminase
VPEHRHAAKESVDKVAVIGTGVQARLQIEALSKVREFGAVAVWGRDPLKAARYAEEMSSVLGMRVAVSRSVQEAVAGSDVIVTATMSTEPLVFREWVPKGAHITAVGSDSPEKQELDVGVLASADKVVCDSIQQCARLGELHHAIEKGAMAETDVHGELGEVLLGKKAGREEDDEITVCDLTGLAVQDVVASQLVYERALKRNIGSFMKV